MYKVYIEAVTSIYNVIMINVEWNKMFFGLLYKPKKSFLSYKYIEQINQSIDVNIWYSMCMYLYTNESLQIVLKTNLLKNLPKINKERKIYQTPLKKQNKNLVQQLQQVDKYIS